MIWWVISLVICRVADWAAQLYKEGLAPEILFSGGRGNFTEAWDEAEASVFARRAVELGVARDAIMVETGSSNTGENIRNSYKLLENLESIPSKVILVQKPFMERR